MTYAQFSTIDASDYNNLIGNTTSSTANLFNTTWATGSSTAGYGQTAINQVPVGTVVTAAQWSTLTNNIANAAQHQGTSITSVTTPTVGNTIAFISALSTNLASVYSNRLNAATQGSTVANTRATTTTWTNVATWTHTVTFANGDAARYFFNSGGQIAMTCAHPSGTGINLLFNNLASNVGTVVLSAPSSGTVSIVGTSYNGVTKIGGGGNAPTVSQNSGYYGLGTANTTVFSQTASTGPTSYLSTNISYIARTNGPQGANGDNGSIVTIHTVWDQIPNGLTVASGSSVTCTVRLPESTYIANSWGAISVSGVVSVS